MPHEKVNLCSGKFKTLINQYFYSNWTHSNKVEAVSMRLSDSVWKALEILSEEIKGTYVELFIDSRNLFTSNGDFGHFYSLS